MKISVDVEPAKADVKKFRELLRLLGDCTREPQPFIKMVQDNQMLLEYAVMEAIASRDRALAAIAAGEDAVIPFGMKVTVIHD